MDGQYEENKQMKRTLGGLSVAAITLAVGMLAGGPVQAAASRKDAAASRLVPCNPPV